MLVYAFLMFTAVSKKQTTQVETKVLGSQVEITCAVLIGQVHIFKGGAMFLPLSRVINTNTAQTVARTIKFFRYELHRSRVIYYTVQEINFTWLPIYTCTYMYNTYVHMHTTLWIKNNKVYNLPCLRIFRTFV